MRCSAQSRCGKRRPTPGTHRLDPSPSSHPGLRKGLRTLSKQETPEASATDVARDGAGATDGSALAVASAPIGAARAIMRARAQGRRRWTIGYRLLSYVAFLVAWQL